MIFDTMISYEISSNGSTALLSDEEETRVWWIDRNLERAQLKALPA